MQIKPYSTDNKSVVERSRERGQLQKGMRELWGNDWNTLTGVVSKLTELY